jgi:hypothetical protein
MSIAIKKINVPIKPVIAITIFMMSELVCDKLDNYLIK